LGICIEDPKGQESLIPPDIFKRSFCGDILFIFALASGGSSSILSIGNSIGSEVWCGGR
jgi:hypothetical protein